MVVAHLTLTEDSAYDATMSGWGSVSQEAARSASPGAVHEPFQSQALEHWLHIAHQSFKPYRPTFQRLEQAEVLAQRQEWVRLRQTGVYVDDMAFFFGLPATCRWQVTFWVLVNTKAPLAVLKPSECSVQRIKAGADVLGRKPRKRKDSGGYTEAGDGDEDPGWPLPSKQRRQLEETVDSTELQVARASATRNCSRRNTMRLMGDSEDEAQHDELDDLLENYLDLVLPGDSGGPSLEALQADGGGHASTAEELAVALERESDEPPALEQVIGDVVLAEPAVPGEEGGFAAAEQEEGQQVAMDAAEVPAWGHHSQPGRGVPSKPVT